MFNTEITDSLVIHTAEANVSLDDIFATMQAWYSDPGFDPSRPVLWDLRAAQVSFSEDDVTTWAASMQQATNEYRAGRKTAWVLPTSEIAELAVDLLSSYDFRNKVRIYQNDIEAAHAWLTTTIR